MEEANPPQAPVIIIMAGGSGTRFWPVSSPQEPKQFLSLTGDNSLIQETVDRALQLTKTENIYIASVKSQLPLIKDQLPQVTNLILEPHPRNTAACLMLSVSQLIRKNYPSNTPLLVFPADHSIGNTPQFIELMRRGVSFVTRHSALVTFGITPSHPHTGYGYIQGGKEVEPGVLSAQRFLEKPDRKLAESFIQQGNFFWNGGIFAWTLQSISEAFDTFLTDDWRQICQAKDEMEIANIFSGLPNQPIDKAILEKAPNVFVIPSPGLNWSDLGSWSALHELKSQKPQENVVMSPQVYLKDVEGCLVQTPSEMQVGLVGLKNLVVVLTNNSLLIMDKEQDQSVKEISDFFNREN